MTPPSLVNVAIGSEAHGWVIAGKWHPNPTERQAAWELLVELSTRIAIVPLRDEEGLLSEALGSLHKVFGETRSIMRHNGPELAEDRQGELSFAVLAGHMLNQILRPVLAYWHPRLSPDPTGPHASTADAVDAAALADLRTILADLQVTLTQLAHVLADACGAQEFLRIQIDNETRQYEPARRRQARGR